MTRNSNQNGGTGKIAGLDISCERKSCEGKILFTHVKSKRHVRVFV
jgi:hypothetical protein